MFVSGRSRLGSSLVLLAALAGAAAPAGAQDESSCVTCHGELDASLTEAFAQDVHAEIGLGCEGCHGGDPSPALAEDAEAAMAPSAGFRGAPDRFAIPTFCGDCHADASLMKQYNPQGRVDQLAEYRTSVHGRRNAQGDPRPATCIDCHGAHGVRRVSAPDSPVFASNVPETCARCHADDAYMAPYQIPTDQYANYRRSVHAAALIERQDTAAPACNDCHGNHGAAPPGVESVANVCGQCHGREAQLFRASFKKELFDAMEMPECTVCHGNHRIVHPTPEMFRNGSAPSVSAGRVVGLDPFHAELDDLAGGQSAEAAWTLVLNPHLEAGDPRLTQVVTVSATDIEPLEIDATVAPGRNDEAALHRETSNERIAAVLDIQPLSGLPVKAGDALRYRLEVRATGQPLAAVEVLGGAAAGLDLVEGSVCLTCHTPGDTCDEVTAVMYEALARTDRDLREAGRLLRRAEVAGMDIGEDQFALNSGGTTAALDARALIHSFEPERLVARAEEGQQVAASAREAGRAALAEIAYRRRGLAISLGLIALVLVGLLLKIREVDRRRRASA